MDQYRAGMENETLKALVALRKADTKAGVDALGELMQATVEQFGDLAPEMGEIYYEYGSACLLLGEESSDMFGSSIQAATKDEATRRVAAEAEQDDEDEEVAVAGSSTDAVAGSSTVAINAVETTKKEAAADTNVIEKKEEASMAKKEDEKEVIAMETIEGTSAAAVDAAAGSEKKEPAGTDETAKNQDGTDADTAQDEEADGPTEEAILEALMVEYKQKNDKEPTEEVLQQWTTTLREAAAENETKKQEEAAAAAAVVEEIKKKEAADAAVKDEEKPTGAVPPADAMAAIAAIAAKAAAASEVAAADAAAIAAAIAEDSEPEQVYQEDVNELFEIAWDSLESSRVILTRVIESEQDLSARNEGLALLSRTFLRLGDLGVEQGSFAGAARDYHKSLNIREKIFQPFSRKIADVSFSLAQALLYAAPDAPEAETQVNLRVRALDGLTKAATILVTYRTKMAEDNAVPVDECSKSQTVGVVGSFDEDEEVEGEGETTDGGKGKAKKTVLMMADVTQDKAIEAAREANAAISKTITTPVEGLDTEVMVQFAEMGEILKDLQMNIEEVIDILLNPPKPETAADDEKLLAQYMAGGNSNSSSGAASSAPSAFGAPTLSADTKVATLSVKSNKVSTLTAKSKTSVRVQANPPGVTEAAVVGEEDRKRDASEVGEAREENSKKVKAADGAAAVVVETAVSEA